MTEITMSKNQKQWFIC